MAKAYNMKTEDGNEIINIHVGADVDNASGIVKYYGYSRDENGDGYGGINSKEIGTGGIDYNDNVIPTRARILTMRIGTEAMDDVNEGFRIYFVDPDWNIFSSFLSLNLTIVDEIVGQSPHQEYALQRKTDVNGDNYYGFAPNDLLEYTQKFSNMFRKNLNNQIMFRLSGSIR